MAVIQEKKLVFVDHKDDLQRRLKDSKFKKEYDRLRPEFERISNEIKRSSKSN
jgi:hypothetical protein